MAACGVGTLASWAPTAEVQKEDRQDNSEARALGLGTEIYGFVSPDVTAPFMLLCAFASAAQSVKPGRAHCPGT